jgi:predicted DNA-binding transcriptional regulator YafY
MSLLERVFYFHQEIQKGRFPNSRSLTEKFEISLATARRDITYLRDRLLAPLAFDAKHNGFYYHEQGFELPFGDNPRIIFLIAMLNKMAGEAGLQGLPEVAQLEQRLSSLIAPEYREVVKNLYVERIEIEAVDEHIFSVMVDGLGRKVLLELEYRAVGDIARKRMVAPLRLMNYQSRWYLYGYCMLRQDYRLFHLGRIVAATLSPQPIPATISGEQSDFDDSFGIFRGKPRYLAKILFTGTAIELVRHQHWHKEQQMTETKDGLLLQLPVNDDRELLMKILQYGQHATVIAPSELVERITIEIERMREGYPRPEQTMKKLVD